MERKNLIEKLKLRFEENTHRHPKFNWEVIESKLLSDALFFSCVNQMEFTGGEPDVVLFSKINGGLSIVDCVKETPKQRVSLCYDEAALVSRKKNKPIGSATEQAQRMGVQLLSESQYLNLQELQAFDLKTSSWILTPDPIRKLGGAIFGDHRFGRTFIYHNGAESYYSSRGFRGIINIEL